MKKTSRRWSSSKNLSQNNLWDGLVTTVPQVSPLPGLHLETTCGTGMVNVPQVSPSAGLIPGSHLRDGQPRSFISRRSKWLLNRSKRYQSLWLPLGGTACLYVCQPDDADLLDLLCACYRLAAERYGVSDLQIGLLAMIFMYIYIPLAIPASWAIDTWGFKKAVGLGAILMAVFGMMRAFSTTSIRNGIDRHHRDRCGPAAVSKCRHKVAAKWFPLHERATVIGLGTVAPFLGIVIGQMLTPSLVTNSASKPC
jgi:hypothetical protein